MVKSCSSDIASAVDSAKIKSIVDSYVASFLQQCRSTCESIATSGSNTERSEATVVSQQYGFAPSTGNQSGTTSSGSNALKCKNGGSIKADGLGCACVGTFSGVDCAIDVNPAATAASINEAVPATSWIRSGYAFVVAFAAIFVVAF
jgi:hypothetical protein